MAQSFQTSFSPSLSNLTDASDRILRSTIEIFIALRLDEIDDSWVRDVWESQVNVNFGFICYHLTSGMFDKLEIFAFLKLRNLAQSNYPCSLGVLRREIYFFFIIIIDVQDLR